MKNIIAILVVLSGLFTVSCNNWLDVKPVTEAEKSDLFSKEAGFESSLIGIYLNLVNSNIYGAALSFAHIEYMADLYDEPVSSTSGMEAALMEHDWDQLYAESAVNSMFSGLYNIIANANGILEEIDVRKDVFATEENYRIIKGEALAIRAMCHLDILRLFGPVPTETTSDLILPYVSTFGKDLTIRSNWEDYTSKLLADLEEAAELMKDVDPIITDSNSALGNPTSTAEDFTGYSTFYAYRYLRFNYYAVKALQARANLWIGNKDAAAEAAIEVIEAKDLDGSPRFALGTSAALSGTDANRLFTSEHIMALSTPNLKDTYDGYFAKATLFKGEGSTISSSLVNLYGSGTDIRNTSSGMWWNTYTDNSGISYGFCSKYFTNDESSDAKGGLRIPLIRVAEMYIIAIEAAPLATAQTYYDEFAGARGMAAGYVLDDNLRSSIAVNEMRKEFYAEGQTFYAYKRNNYGVSQILWPAMEEPSYVIPLPINE